MSYTPCKFISYLEGVIAVIQNHLGWFAPIICKLHKIGDTFGLAKAKCRKVEGHKRLKAWSVILLHQYVHKQKAWERPQN
jgi:hypothetical protein